MVGENSNQNLNDRLARIAKNFVTTKVKIVRSCHKNPVSTDKTKTEKTPCT